MRRFAILLIVLIGMAGSLYAQTQTTVTGTIQSVTGGTATSGYVEFRLAPTVVSGNAILYYVANTLVLAPMTARCAINASGAVVALTGGGACLLWGNPSVTPANSTYTVILAPNGNITSTVNRLLISGATYSLNAPVFASSVTVTPQFTTLFAAPIEANIVPVTTNQFNVGSGGKYFAAGYFDQLFVNSLNYSVVNTHCSTGATANAKIAAEIALLPSTGGTADCSSLEGAQSITADPFSGVTKPVRLILGAATFTTTVEWNPTATGTQLECHNTTIKAATMSQSIVRWTAAQGRMSGCTLDGDSVSGTTGLRVAPTSESGTTVRTVTSFNEFRDLRIQGADEGIVITTGPTVTALQSDASYNSFSHITLNDNLRGIWLKQHPTDATTTSPNTNDWFGVKCYSTGVRTNTCVQIDAGDTNHFYGLESIGMANGSSPNATPTALYIRGASPVSSADNNSNYVYGLRTENDTRCLNITSSSAHWTGIIGASGCTTAKVSDSGTSTVIFGSPYGDKNTWWSYTDATGITTLNPVNGVSITTPLSLTTALTTANGGTGLAAPGANGNVLTSNGTIWTSAAGGGGAVSSVTGTALQVTASPTTGAVVVGLPSAVTITTLTLTNPLAVANGGSNCAVASITCFNNITGYTASGATGTTSTNLVFSASPTFTGTPILPTPFTIGAVSMTATGTQLNYLNAATGTTGTASTNVVFSASPTFTGTPVLPTPFTIGAVSMTATGTQLNYLNAATGTTGTASTNVVFSTSPTIVTPTITTSINVPLIKPPSDSTTAVKITKANGTTAVMTVDTTNGRVGIGATPDYALHVDKGAGSGVVQQWASSVGNGFLVIGGTGTLYFSTSTGAEDSMGINAGGHQVDYYLNNILTARFAPVGLSVGGGVTTPTYVLDVQPTSGATAGSTAIIRDATASTGKTTVVLKGGAVAGNILEIRDSGNNLKTSFADAGTMIFAGLTTASGTPSSICQNAGTGEITVNAALTCTVSARDQKQQIQPIGFSALSSNWFDRLSPVEFRYNDNPDRVRFGFIADELQSINPALADAYDKDGNARSIDANAILAVTVKAVQELEARVHQLENK